MLRCGTTAEVLHTWAVTALVVAKAGSFQHLKVAGQRPVRHLDLVDAVQQQSSVFASKNFGHEYSLDDSFEADAH